MCPTIDKNEKQEQFSGRFTDVGALWVRLVICVWCAEVVSLTEDEEAGVG